MKTLTPSFVLAIAAAMVISAASSLAGTETGSAKGGASDLVERSAAAPSQQATLKMNHAGMAKNCPSCQTISTTQTVTDGKRSLTTTLPVQQHLCGDCKTTLATNGHGKTKVDTAVHVCKQAAGKTGSCCAN